MRRIIIDAIQTRKVLSFSYDGLRRVVEPHAVGRSRTGNEVLRCFQTKGGHVTPGHEWDFCVFSKIKDLAVTGETFSGERPGYRRGDSHMTEIYAEL